MSQQWAFSLQRQLPGNWVVELTYTGNHGTHLVAGSYDLNQLTPDQYRTYGTALQNSVPNPYAGIVPGSLGGATITVQQSLAAFPYYTTITVRNPHLGNSIYHAGLLRVEKRFSHGLTFLASYTKGKLIDDSVASPDHFRQRGASINRWFPERVIQPSVPSARWIRLTLLSALC